MDFMDLDGVNVEMDFLLRPDDPTLGLLDAELGSAFFNDLDAPLGDYLDNTVEDQFCNKLLDQMEDMEPETDHAYAALSPGGSVGSASGSSFSGDHGYLSPSTSPVDVLDTATQEIFEVPHQTTYELKQRSQPVQRQPPRPYQLPPVAPKRPSLVAPSRNSGGPRTVIRFKPALRASGGTIAGSTPAASSSLLAPSSIKLSGPSTKLTGGERTRKYPPLTLTDEEKRLCKKEGIQLPDHYPLTKAEERDLKRIRRKIRNKRSAQTSRKRKQDYIEQLEDRVADCSQENHELKMRIEELSRENESIVAQLRKLQTSLGQGSRRGVQAGTCLAVLVLSMCLLVAPNLSPFGKIRAIESEEQTLAIQRAQHRLNRREVGQAPVHGRSRTLMDFVQNPPTADEYCADEVAKVEKIEEAAVPQEPPKNFYRDNEPKKKPVSNNQKPVNGRFKEPPPKGYQYAGDVDLPPPPNPKNVIHYVPARLVQTGNSNNYTNKVYAQQPPSTQPPPAKRFKTEPL